MSYYTLPHTPILFNSVPYTAKAVEAEPDWADPKDPSKISCWNCIDGTIVLSYIKSIFKSISKGIPYDSLYQK